MGFVGSTTALTSNSTWTSQVFLANRADRIVGTVFADQSGTIYIEQSGDGGLNWDISTSYPVTASDGKGFSEDILAGTIRIRFVNDGTGQGVFRISARTDGAGDS